MLLGTLEKQPGERRLQVFDYTEALAEGDTVAAAVLKSVSPEGILVDSVVPVSPKVSFWVYSGTTGVKYTVTLTVTTAHGEIFEDELAVRVREVS